MRILMIASEAVPYAKTGGLADVLGALPRAIARLGHAVDVVLPRYRGIDAGAPAGHLFVRDGHRTTDASIYVDGAEGLRMVFVDHPEYYDRPYLYGSGNDDYPDNPARFAFLARAGLEWGARAEEPYAAVHAHDWQAGLAPVLLQQEFRSAKSIRSAPSLFTVHNLAYQGLCDANWLPRLGLGPELMHVNALEYWGRISLLKAGIVFSRFVTTVSPQYAREIQTPEFGFGFDGILRGRSTDLIGILNGIDYDQWDPARDPHLPAPFDVSRLDGKAEAKRAVLQTFGLPAEGPRSERPLVAMISRLVDQKGFDLLAESRHELPRLDASFVLLGTGERRYEDLWRGLAESHPDRFGVRIGFDEAMAHRIEGGADMFLMPSRFEPCGLNQMYSLRYGTVPVVRATGGLADTVQDFDPVSGSGTGFTFREYTAVALMRTLRRALDAFQDRASWRRLQVAGMRQDPSWDESARKYLEAYERMAGSSGSAAGAA